MELIPSSRNTSPMVTPIAAKLSHGSIMQTKPAIIRIMPSARTQPHARTPRARRSNELTNREIPENSSQSANRNGSDSFVNHWLKSRNRDIITVSTPSSSSQPEPIQIRFVPANTTISAIPAASVNRPSNSAADITAISLLHKH